MTRESSSFDDIGSAVSDDNFPDVDLALRRGRHIDRDDGAWYSYLVDAQPLLETFYRRFGCELVHKSDGYFYLLPTGDRLGRRQLSTSEMLVGQALALLYLDPATVQNGGVITRDDVLGHMASVMGTDGLMAAFNPKKKRLDERVAQETVRTRVAEGLRKLTAGGFLEALEGDAYRLRSALMRFAEPVRTSDSPAEALRRLVEKGEVVLVTEDEPTADDDEDALANSDGVDDEREVDASDGDDEPRDADTEGDDDASDGDDEPRDAETADEAPDTETGEL